MNAPFLVFLAVATADGKVDKKEGRAFHKILAQAGDLSSQLLRQVLAQATDHAAQFIEALSSGKITPLEELESIKKIAGDRLDEEEANLFKKSLLAIGIRVAEASGGLFGFGSKISKQEKAALAALATTLELKLDS